MAQRLVPLRWHLSLPLSVQPAQLWPWLLTIDSESAGQRGSTSPGMGPRRIPDIIGQLLWLCGRLAAIARLPLFAPARVIAKRAGRRSGPTNDAEACLDVMVSVPVADEASLHQWRALLSASQRVATWVSGQGPLPEPGWEGRAALADYVHGLLKAEPDLQPLGGKSVFHILKAAHDAGIPALHISGTVYQLGWGTKARRIDRSLSDTETLIGARLTHNKMRTAQLLSKAGLPGAVHACVTDIQQARSAAPAIGWPVVIKPADGERGEGVSVDVEREGLDAAFAAALRASPARRVLVERQAAGVCHRLFIAGGRLLYAVKRLPIGVHGDGLLDVAQLVEREADRAARLPPWRREPAPTIDAEAIAELSRQGLLVTDVPAAGAFVSLRRIETTAAGGIDEDVTDIVHPQNVRAAEAAASVSGLAVAGVDMISGDITRPWFENGAIINEVNYAPMLGEGLISRRHVGRYVERLMGGNGRIPVAVFVGGALAAAAARAQAARWQDMGLSAAVTSHDMTELAGGEPLIMPHDQLFDRVQALVLRRTIDALAIIVANDGLVDTGLPLEGVDHVAILDPLPGLSPGPNARIRHEQLMQLIRLWPWDQREAGLPATL